MRIEQFRYGTDNLAYLVFSGTSGVAIDPGAADEMVRFAREHDISIDQVTNTHLHPDHTCGNAEMLEKPAPSTWIAGPFRTTTFSPWTTRH